MICMSVSARSVVVGVRQQREKARTLDRILQLALVARLRAREPRRNDLAGVGDEILQQIDVLVVDPLDLLRGEAAELLALEQRGLRRARSEERRVGKECRCGWSEEGIRREEHM